MTTLFDDRTQVGGRNWFGAWLPPELTTDWYKWAVTVTNIPEVLKNSYRGPGRMMATVIAIPRLGAGATADPLQGGDHLDHPLAQDDPAHRLRPGVA